MMTTRHDIAEARRYLPGPNSSKRTLGIRDFRPSYLAMTHEDASPAHAIAGP